MIRLLIELYIGQQKLNKEGTYHVYSVILYKPYENIS